jgi:predicted ATPase
MRNLHGEEQLNLVALADALSHRLEEIEEIGLLSEETITEVEDLVTATIDSEALAERWARELVEARGEALQDLVLIDKRTGTAVSHRDVGIGVSQVLPVLVSAYASDGMFVAIEQPEIHLHPALQAELGDVFLESALGPQRNAYLIETHSEHLILRMLRRIRETTDGALPSGLPRVRPEDVSVLYVQPGREGAEVVHIPVTEEGEFHQPWPEGFFAERARELF